MAGRRVPDPQAVAIGIYKVNLPTPWLFQYFAIELPSDCLEVVDSKVDERVLAGVTSVLGQEQPGASVPGKRYKCRETWLKSVLPLLCVP